MKKTKSKNKKIIVAMSGGVDSSVATALLKEGQFLPAGRQVDVIGVFMKLDKLKSSKVNERRAKSVAKKLGISFKVLDFRKEFKKRVIDYFLKEYKSGATPNPCVVCNKEVKFDLLFKKLPSFKADFVATGHYARLRRAGAGYKLLKARDKNKDQSYFLWRLNQKILRKTLFPVGGYTKTEVRKLAKEFKLPVIDIPESQEVCFIPTTISDFLRKHLKSKPGKIINSQGKVVGQHQGLWFYTIGQRRGLELSGGIFYVLSKNIRKNILIVTKNEEELYKKELITKKINWILGKASKLPLKVKAAIRYKHRAAGATLKKDKNGRIKVIFAKKQKAITPGQSVVFYKNQELLGGGIIL